MNRIIIVVLIMATLTGCRATTLSQVRFENKRKLSNIRLGMSEQEVLKIMGTKPIKAYSRGGEEIGIINNPYKSEIIEREEHKLKVLYYYTQIRHSDGVIGLDELTPLVIEDEKLIGVGWGSFEDIAKKYKMLKS